MRAHTSSTHRLQKDLPSIRAALSPDEQALLDRCWSHYALGGEAMSKRDLNHEFGTPNVNAALRSMPRGLLRLASNIGSDAYGVSFLGTLATSEAHELEALLERYISALKASYLDDHHRRTFALADLSRFARFSTDEITRLGRVLTCGITLAGASVRGQSADGSWLVGLSNDAESVRRIEDPIAYVRERAFEQASLEAAYPFGGSVIEASFLDGAGERSFRRTGAGERDPESDALDLSLIADERLRAICERDWHDATLCLRHGIFKAAVILGGAIAEAVLLDAVERKDAHLVESALLALKVRENRINKLTLEPLTKVAQHLKLISGARVHLAHALREHRNLIHPARERDEPMEIDEEAATTALTSVRWLVAELRRSNGST